MPALHPLCANRRHDWGASGAVPGAQCVRPGCSKRYGVRLPNGATAPPVSATSAPAATATGQLRAAAARLAERRGFVAAPGIVGKTADLETPSLEPGPAPDDRAPKAKRYSMSEWFGGHVPDAVVAGEEYLIRKVAKREPWAPSPVWKKRFDESYHATVDDFLPRLEVSPPVALIIAAIAMFGTMFVGARKLPPDKTKAEPPPPTVPPVLASVPRVKESPAWETKPQSQSPVATPLSVHSIGGAETGQTFPNDSSRPDTSGADGSANSAPRSA